MCQLPTAACSSTCLSCSSASAIQRYALRDVLALAQRWPVLPCLRSCVALRPAVRGRAVRRLRFLDPRGMRPGVCCGCTRRLCGHDVLLSAMPPAEGCRSEAEAGAAAGRRRRRRRGACTCSQGQGRCTRPRRTDARVGHACSACGVHKCHLRVLAAACAALCCAQRCRHCKDCTRRSQQRCHAEARAEAEECMAALWPRLFRKV